MIQYAALTMTKCLGATPAVRPPSRSRKLHCCCTADAVRMSAQFFSSRRKPAWRGTTRCQQYVQQLRRPPTTGAHHVCSAGCTVFCWCRREQCPPWTPPAAMHAKLAEIRVDLAAQHHLLAKLTVALLCMHLSISGISYPKAFIHSAEIGCAFGIGCPPRRVDGQC